MVIDHAVLWLMCSNLTALDTTRSRSFAVVTRKRADVQQALKLFDADASRQPFEPVGRQLVVSPENARAVLTDFIRKAKQPLLIYDPKVSDGSMIKLLTDSGKRAKAKERADDDRHERGARRDAQAHA